MPFVTTPRSTLFFTEVGSPTATPILFSNSLGTTHRMWDAVIAELAPSYRCLRYDTRGHGYSPVAASPFEIEDLARDVVDLLDHCGIERVHVAGLSLGGMTGQALAIHFPERVASLSLMATSAHMPPASAWLERAALVREKGTAAVAEGAMDRWFTPGFRASPVVAALRSELESQKGEGYAACCEVIARFDLRAGLARITAPTQVLAGEEDPATPLAMAEGLVAGITGARLERLSPAAHLLAVEQPARVAQLLTRFIGA